MQLKSDNKHKTLSIIIPVYNEEKTVLELLDQVVAANLSINKEIIIVNDGSTDNSPGLIEDWIKRREESSDYTIVFISQENGGKGSAVRTGIKRSTGDIVIIQDADLEYNPEDYQKCINPILSGVARVVYGSRELSEDRRKHSHLTFFLGGLMVSNWINLLFGSDMTDEPTCYKTFDGNLIRTILFKGNKFEWEPEITAKLLRLGYKIHEVPIEYKPRKLHEGKKINWRDGVQALWIALIWRFLPLGDEKKKLQVTEKDQQLLIKKQKMILISVLVITLVLRLLMIIPGLANPEKTFFRPDSSSYVQPALSLAEHGSYNNGPDSSEPATLRPPGFSAFLSVIFLFNNGGLKLPVLIFCILGTLTCLMVFCTGRLFGGYNVGIIAALLFSLNITSISAVPFFLSDLLFAFLSVLQLYFFSRFYFNRNILFLWISIFLAGLATLTRPVSLLWIIPCMFLILIFKEWSWKKRLAGILSCLLIFLAVITPWMLRNKMIGAGFSLSTNAGETLLFHNGAVLQAHAKGGSPEAIRAQMRKDVQLEFTRNPEKYPDEKSKMNYKIGKFIELFKQHPLLYLSLHIRPAVLIPDVASFFELLGMTQSGRGTFDVLNRQGLFAAIKHYFGGKMWLLLLIAPGLLIVGITYAGCLAELIIWLVQKKWFLFFFFLAFIEYYLFMPGPITMPRYHLPALPFMTIMAALLINNLYLKMKEKSK